MSILMENMTHPLCCSIVFLVLALSGCGKEPNSLLSVTTSPQSTKVPAEIDSDTKSKTYWSGISGGFSIDWTADGLFIRASPSDEPQNIFTRMADEGVKNLSSGNEPILCRESGKCLFQRDFRLVSVFGHYLTLEEDVSMVFHESPQNFRDRKRLTTIDLAKVGGKFYSDGYFFCCDGFSERKKEPFVQIDELFDSRDVLAALLMDSDIESALRSSGVKPDRLTNLNDFAKALRPGRNGGCPLIRNDTYEFCSDQLSNFVIKRIDSGRAIVDLKIFSGSPYVREPAIIILDLPLSIEMLEVAQTAKSDFSGFFQEYADKYLEFTTKIEIPF